MTTERWEQVEALFAAALDHPAAERAAYLLAACPDDPALRAEARGLLDADEAAAVYFRGLQSDAVPLISPSESRDLIGQEIGPWRVLDVLGYGGMGHVYLAERADGLYEQRVALKVLRPGREASEMYQRFRAERQILASLDHPGIARLIGGGIMPYEDSPDLPYLVMEYVEGRPIDVYCAEHELGLRDRVRLFLGVCSAVHYAHQNLVVHRDLKPTNVLVMVDEADGTPSVKLLDFGIAKLLGPARSGSTRTTHPPMTPEFASPEQVSGAPITTAADVYQLGLLLYVLLTGHRPYSVDGLSLSDFAHVVLEQPPERPSAIVSEAESRALRGDLNAILLKALRKEPGTRYPSAESLGDDLARYLQGLPVEAHRGSTAYRLQKLVRRHRAGFFTAVLVFITLLGGGILYNVRVTAERNRAAAAAAKAEHVTDYLLGLFREDGWGEGGTAQAREASLALLGPAARRLASDLQGDPEVQAQLSHAFGELFSSLGRYNLAQTMLRRAVALRDSLSDIPPADVAASLHEYGHFLGFPGNDRDSAAYYLGRAVDLRRSLPHEKSDLAESLLLYSRYLPEDDTRREALFDESLSILRRLHGPKSAEVGRALHAYYRKGGGTADTTAAIAGLRTAVSILSEATGSSLETALALEDLGFLLEATPQSNTEALSSEGLDFLRRAYTMNKAATGIHGPHVLRMGTNYGRALHRRGRLAEADTLFRRLLSTADTPPIEGSAGHGYALYWHGLNLLALDRRAEAAEALRTAQAIWRRAHPEGRAISRAIERSLSEIGD